MWAFGARVCNAGAARWPRERVRGVEHGGHGAYNGASPIAPGPRTWRTRLCGSLRAAGALPDSLCGAAAAGWREAESPRAPAGPPLAPVAQFALSWPAATRAQALAAASHLCGPAPAAESRAVVLG